VAGVAGVAGVGSATSTPNDDRQTRLDADQLRTHFELKTAEARKGLGGGGFGGVQVEVARVVRRWLRSTTGLPRDTCTALFRFTGRP